MEIELRPVAETVVCWGGSPVQAWIPVIVSTLTGRFSYMVHIGNAVPRRSIFNLLSNKNRGFKDQIFDFIFRVVSMEKSGILKQLAVMIGLPAKLNYIFYNREQRSTNLLQLKGAFIKERVLHVLS